MKRTFQIYRYDPDKDAKPYMQTLEVELTTERIARIKRSNASGLMTKTVAGLYVHAQEWGSPGISIWAGPGKYETICTVAIIFEDNEAGITLIDWVDLQLDWEVSGEPGPVPDDPEDPVDPQTGFDDVSALVADLVRPVRDSDKVENCQILATAYREHGGLARDGAYKDADELADSCNATYQFQLGINTFLRYRPAMTLLRAEIGKMMKAGRMQDMDDWGNLWIAIGDGFEDAAEEVSDAAIPNTNT